MKEYGLAIDLGTTNLVGALVDPVTGAFLLKKTIPNPQGKFGSDVITRIERMRREPDGELTRVLLSGIRELENDLISNLYDTLSETGSRREEPTGFHPEESGDGPSLPQRPDCSGKTDGNVFCVTKRYYAGNTILEHFAAGLDPSSIAVPPFRPVSLFGRNSSCPDLAPCVSGYVGGDVTSALAALGLDETEETVLFIDIGTNGEMALGNRYGFLTAATAAGPCFSGAGEKGSVLIDLVAIALKEGKIGPSGRLRKPDDKLTQNAIRNFQLAKAAVRAGAETLLALRGIRAENVGRLILAGDFGGRIDPEAAKRTGLIPDIPSACIEQPGNTALSGAALGLTEKGKEHIERTASLCSYLELSESDAFKEYYLREINFRKDCV